MALNDKEHLPKIVTDISGINDVLLAIDPEIIQMRTDISNLLKELYMRTTDALITRWENDFSLKYDASLSLAQRRQRVLNKLARKKVLTWKNLRALIKSNIGENAQFYISNDSANYYFRIMIDPEMEEVFDRSKFTVVGSPKITDDGIASGFSSGNRLTSTINIPATYNKLEILSPIYNIENDSNTENYVVSYANSFAFSSIYGLVAIRAYNVTEGRFCLFRNYTGVVRPSVGDIVQGKIVYKNNTCTAYYKNITTGSDWIPIGRQEGATSPTTPFPMSGVMNIGAQGSNQYYKRGWLDLKQFKITVDGKEVFNGTKTVPKGITGLQQAIKQAKPAYLLFDVVVTDFFKKYCGTFYCNQEPI